MILNLSTVLIITVNYNSQDSLRDLIDSTKSLSTDGVVLCGLVLDVTGEVSIGSLPDNFKLIRVPENRGYAYALNIGLKTAAVNKVDYVWILNPDVVLEELSLSPLMKVSFENPRAVVGSAVYALGGMSSDRVAWGIGGFVSGSGEVSMREVVPTTLSNTLECDYVPGCSIFLPVGLLPEIGYLPEEYFLYFEETEWCLKAKAKGIKMLISLESEIKHRVYPGKLEETYRVYFYNRGRRLFLWRCRDILKSNILETSLREVPKAFWSMFRSPLELRETFLAHFLSLVDFFRISFHLPWKVDPAIISRKRLKAFLGHGKANS